MKNLFYVLFFGFILSVQNSNAQNGPTASSAPDAYGYIWRTDQDTDPSKPKAQWIDLTKKPNGVIDITPKLDDDNVFGPINFSFDFPYYWYTENSLYISANGAICFKPNTLGAAFDMIPTIGGQTDDYIAAFLTDLQCNKTSPGNSGNPSKVLFYTDFKDTVVVSWIDVPFLIPGGYAGANTFQIVLSRIDQSITMNYTQQIGEVGDGCTDGTTDRCLVVGIENISGQVGLPYVQDATGTTRFKRATALTPMSIKYYRPQNSSYKNKDLSTTWNHNPKNGGIIVAKESTPVQLIANIKNQGLEMNPAGKVTALAKVFKQNTTSSPLSTTTMNIGPISVGKDTLLTFSSTVPTNVADFYRFESIISWPNTSSTIKDGDQVSANNKISQYVGVVDTSKSPIPIYYCGDQSGSGFTFLGGDATFSAGVGTYYDFPFYPAKIKTFKGNFSTYPVGGTSPSDQLKIRIYDDDGVNLFGKKDGSPGTLLLDSVLLPTVDWKIGNNEFIIKRSIPQINSGGVYLAAFQGGAATSYGVESDNNHHYRGYEVFNGVFSPFRNNNSQDIMLGIGIDKGNFNIISDLAIDSILSPQALDPITDSVQVIVRLKNIGKKIVTGSFDIAFKADLRDEVIEVTPSDFTVPIDGTVEYTFKKYAKGPPFPRQTYNDFCVKISPPNDFNLVNNTKCYQTKLGVKNESNLNNLFLFPNPSNGELNVLFSIVDKDNVQLSIYDLTGKQLRSQNLGVLSKGFFEQKFNLTDLSNGIYILKIHTNKGLVVKKFNLAK